MGEKKIPAIHLIDTLHEDTTGKISSQKAKFPMYSGSTQIGYHAPLSK